MNLKPVKPTLHTVNDYVLSGVLLAAPQNLHLNKKAAATYGVLGAGFLTVNALTNTPAGIKRVLSFKTHQRTDAAFLVSFSMLTLAAAIRKDKKALRFHLIFLAVAVTHYVLTDYNAGSKN